MVNVDIILLIAFIFILSLIMLLNKKKVRVEKLFFPILYIIMYRTKFGLNKMDNIANKHPRLVSFLSNMGIFIGFLGMIFMFVLLIINVYVIFKQPIPQAGVAILLPGVEIPGLPKISFWHWIIALLILVIVHEFFHGVVARLHKIKIKSSGFAVLSVLLPVIPAAFVEPDEKNLVKKSKKAQMSVFAAGSLANFITAFLFWLLLFAVFDPVLPSLIETNGVKVVGFADGFPIKNSGINVNDEVKEINNAPVNSVNDFLGIMQNVKPGDSVNIKTNVSSYNIIAAVHPENKDRGYLGVFVSGVETKIKDNIWWASAFFWIRMAFWWIFIINFFVGLFNLLPFFILDGGRMFYTLSLYIFKNNEVKSKKLFKLVNVIIILLLLLNFFPTLVKYIGNFFVAIF